MLKSTNLSDEKRDQIINAVLKIYQHTPYHEITFSQISKELSITETKLKKHVGTKEEIFLLIIMQDLIKWINDVEVVFNVPKVLNPEEFAVKWIKTISKHRRLLNLLSLVHKIESNVSEESLSNYKDDFYQEYERLFEIIPKVLPWLKKDKLQNFLRTQFYYSVGLNPSVRLNHIQQDIVNEDASSEISLFEKEFTQFIISFLISQMDT